MARDVYAVLKEALVLYGGQALKEEDSAESYLKEMKVRQRYLQDIWS